MSQKTTIIVVIGCLVVLGTVIIAPIIMAYRVSAEITDAFHKLGSGLARTNENFIKKNEITYKQFEYLNSDTAKLFFNKAKKVRLIADEICNYLESIKKRVILSIEKKPDHESNMNASFFGKDSLADEIKTKLQAYADSLAAISSVEINSSLFRDIRKGFEDSDTKNFFHDMPAAACISILARYQNDERNAEADMIHLLFDAIPKDTLISDPPVR